MLYNKLKDYSQSKIYPFHMPGHKRTDITAENILPYKLDITEIFGFDNLHEPAEAIKSIHNKVEKLYSVKNAFMLVNGATCGILAAIRSITNYGDKILIARNCHKSVYNAAEICGLDVKYILPQLIDEYGIFSSIEPDAINTAFLHDSDIKAVVITSPTYEGVVSDVSSIAKICHKYNAKLFVDEAHGAHFPFSDFFPNEAVSCGADIAVVSLHKTLPALTQTALLLTNDEAAGKALSNNLAVFETSSPSYILMSSVEICLDYINKNKALFDRYKSNLLNFLKFSKKLNNLKILSAESNKSIFDYDKSKIIISTANTDINGKHLSDMLREKYYIETEMSYTDYVIAMTSVCDTDSGFQRLKSALTEIDKQCLSTNFSLSSGYANNKSVNQCYNLPEKSFKSVEIYKHNSSEISFKQACGRISLEYVWAYPPGIPIIVPGEIISREIINYIEYLLSNNVEVYSSSKKLPHCITVAEN